MQDTTTSAMTEVALGLSMAFFTLLIVALLSMSVPIKTDDATAKMPKDIQKDAAIDIQMANKDSPNSNDDSQFVFYFEDKFYDQSLTLRAIDSFSKQQNLIIAVNPNLTFAEVFTLRQQVNHPKLSITASNKNWHNRLQQLTRSD